MPFDLFRFICQNTEILPVTRCAEFCYTISVCVIKGSALLGSAIPSRGLWAHQRSLWRNLKEGWTPLNLEFELPSSKDKDWKAEKLKNGKKQAQKLTVFIGYIPRYWVFMNHWREKKVCQPLNTTHTERSSPNSNVYVQGGLYRLKNDEFHAKFQTLPKKAPQFFFDYNYFILVLENVRKCASHIPKWAS